MKLKNKLKFLKDQENSNKLKLLVMSSQTIKNGQPFSVYPLLMEEKLSMDTFNYILLKAESNKWFKDMLVLLVLLLSTMILTDQTFSVLSKEKLVNKVHQFIFQKYHLLLKDSKSINLKLKSFMILQLPMISQSLWLLLKNMECSTSSQSLVLFISMN